jgi:two-component system, response regulator PdtaR
MKILIVEDNALVALDLEQQLLSAGHSVAGIAATVEEAVDLASDGANLALVDVLLADGSSGADAAAELKERFNIPCVFVTATLPEQPEVRRMGLGHLSKPYTGKDVLDTVAAAAAMIAGGRPANMPPRFTPF